MKKLACLVFLSTLIPSHAQAVWPPPEGADLQDPANQPNDAGYPRQWNLFSYIPAASAGRVTPYELSIGAGIHADRAWQKTIGDRRVIIAVIDSGAIWKEPDLANKYYLNRGELPVPDVACGTATGLDLYDVNNDGFFNIQDYTTAVGHDQPTAASICEPGLVDMNLNGILDPQDLLIQLSDGVDDDLNGYVDDISGWDMFHNDNDAFDDTDFGHGRGEAKDSGGEGNNSIGDLGVCPECTIMMVRAGDSFVVDANEWAASVFFAIDSGAAVIQEALGAINNPAVARDALDYAVEQGAVVIASAADEDSFHHNMPGTNNHNIYVHANVFDSTSVDQATTFLNFNNCTNYGAQLLLSTPGTGCSSEATGITSGAVGLLQSAALSVNLPALDVAGYDTDQFNARRLHGEEIKQLLLVTVDDIHDPATADDPTRYPTRVGWEMRFGYGRTNIRKAIDEVLAMRIPPVVDILTPGWFTVLYPEQTPTVDITGEIRYRNAIFDNFDYVVEWAPGIEPDDIEFSMLAQDFAATQDIIGVLATWDISALTIDNGRQPEPDVDVNRNMVTVRVRVTLHGPGGVEGTRGEMRRAYHIVRDPDLVQGYPVDLNAGGEASAKISDLDNDGKMELIQLDASGWLHVLDATGQEKTGWPQGLDLMAAQKGHDTSAAVVSGAWDPDSRSSSIATPAIGDLDGSADGPMDIVAASLDGAVFAFSSTGQVLPGFPVAVDPDAGLNGTVDNLIDVGIFAAPVLADLDNDGDLEIIVGAYDGYLYVWHHDGTAANGFPLLLQSREQQRRIVATPAVGDIDGDGFKEIVCGTTEDYNNSSRIYAVNHDGTFVAGWPIPYTSLRVLPLIGEGMNNAMALADIDGDGDVEIAVAAVVVPPTIFDGDAKLLGTVNNTDYGPGTTSDDNPAVSMVATGSFGDLNNNGVLDLVWGTAGFGAANAFAGSGQRTDFDHQMGAWEITKTSPSRGYAYLDAFPQRTDDWQFFENPAIADIDGDDLPEIISGSGGYYLRAWNHRGEEPAGWPKMTGQWIIASPAVGDMDGDGLLEVAVATRSGFLYAWHTQGRTAGRVDWSSFHHDDRNTGNYSEPLAFGTVKIPGGGCGCRVARTGPLGGSALWVVGGVFLLGWRRRRRPRRRQ